MKGSPRAWDVARIRELALDAALAAGIFSLVWLPAPSGVAGTVFAGDLFYHWDHFMMAQAVAHLHGMALALDVYAPYGLGWPTLMSSLSPVLPLSHQNVIAFCAAFGGLYFASLYGLFRIAVPRRSLALAGTFMALGLGFFSPLLGDDGGAVSNWQWPSMIFVRAPFDVFFFIALLVHARTGRPAGAIAVGILAALSLVFETDTGLMIVGTYAVYWACTLLFRGRPQEAAAGEEGDRATSVLSTFALGLVGFGLVSIICFSFATHGRFLSEPIAFFGGWLGGLTNAVSVSARLFTAYAAENPSSLVLTFGMLGICLLAVVEVAMKSLHRRLDPMSLFLGCVGLYGAGRLVLFAWNSEAIRTRFIGISAAIILVVVVSRAVEAYGAGLRAGGAGLRVQLVLVACWLFALVSAVAVLSSPTFLHYPNVWKKALLVQQSSVPDSAMTYLFPDRREVALDLPMDTRIGHPIRVAIQEVKALVEAGEQVAVLDERKTIIYLHSGARPWSGDAAHFMNTWTREASQELRERFRETGPAYVLMQRGAPERSLTRDTWLELRMSLHPRYRVLKELPVFDLLVCDRCLQSD